ncbi:MAG: hypothetical protein K6G16_11485 [Lachnospiraceae bacterium]|nr:hypothetical protein [Lachnospiraceae bacterium]
MLFPLCALPVHASAESAVFITQSAALETSTVRGLLADISADVRGPASSYTLTIDSCAGDDVKALLQGTRYDLIECYDLSLTAVNSQNITRNPQFGDVTITIPLGSSMNPEKGTFAIYTINTDGSLQKISCSVIYGNSSAYAVRFLTIHFSTYAIVYTSGGSTRVTGSRRNSSASSGITSITNNNNTNAENGASNRNDGSGTGNSGTGASGSGNRTGTVTNGASNASASTGSSTAIAASANGKDQNGKGPDGKDPYYDNPKTGDRRYYSTISAAILVTAFLFFVIARSKKRISR